MIGSKKDIIFYIVAANVIGVIAGLAGASMTAIILACCLGPPLLLLVLRILHLF